MRSRAQAPGTKPQQASSFPAAKSPSNQPATDEPVSNYIIILRESSISDLCYENLASFPGLRGAMEISQDAGLSGVYFLQSLVQTILEGARNSQPWQNLATLEDQVPLFAGILKKICQDYETDTALTSFIVVREPGQNTQIYARGSENLGQVVARQAFVGLGKNRELRENRDGQLVAIAKAKINFGNSHHVRKAGTEVGKLYPPDEWGQLPGGDLAIPKGVASLLVTRSLEQGLSATELRMVDTDSVVEKYGSALKQGDLEPAKRLVECLKMEAREGDDFDADKIINLQVHIGNLRTFLIGRGTDIVEVSGATVRLDINEVYPSERPSTVVVPEFRFFLVEGPSRARTAQHLKRLKEQVSVALELDFTRAKAFLERDFARVKMLLRKDMAFANAVLNARETDTTHEYLMKTLQDLDKWQRDFIGLKNKLDPEVARGVTALVTEYKERFAALGIEVHDIRSRRSNKQAKIACIIMIRDYIKRLLDVLYLLGKTFPGIKRISDAEKEISKDYGRRQWLRRKSRGKMPPPPPTLMSAVRAADDALSRLTKRRWGH